MASMLNVKKGSLAVVLLKTNRGVFRPRFVEVQDHVQDLKTGQTRFLVKDSERVLEDCPDFWKPRTSREDYEVPTRFVRIAKQMDERFVEEITGHMAEYEKEAEEERALDEIKALQAQLAEKTKKMAPRFSSIKALSGIFGGGQSPMQRLDTVVLDQAKKEIKITTEDARKSFITTISNELCETFKVAEIETFAMHEKFQLGEIREAKLFRTHSGSVVDGAFVARVGKVAEKGHEETTDPEEDVDEPTRVLERQPSGLKRSVTFAGEPAAGEPAPKRQLVPDFEESQVLHWGFDESQDNA